VFLRLLISNDYQLFIINCKIHVAIGRCNDVNPLVRSTGQRALWALRADDADLPTNYVRGTFSFPEFYGTVKRRLRRHFKA